MNQVQESIGAALAKNLVVARVVLGVTQEELARQADISRATIAQIETGDGDPRLSTIAGLSSALGIPATLLLTRSEDVRVTVGLLDTTAAQLRRAVTIRASDLERMRRLTGSGMLKDRLRAAQIGAAVVKATEGAGAASEVCSAIYSAVLPGPGTVAGAVLGGLISNAAEQV